MKGSIAIIFFFLALSVGLNNIVIGYKFAGISYDRLFQLFFFVFLSFSFKEYYKNKEILALLVFIFFLSVLYVFGKISLLVQGEEVFIDEFIRGLVRTLMYFVFVYIVFVLLDNYKWTINIILVVFFLAFLLAFFQNPLTPLTDFSQSLRLELFANNMKDTDLEIYSTFLEDEARNFTRVSGPYGQTITLSYALVSAAIISAFCYVYTKKYHYLAFTFFTFIVSIMTLTRSAVLAILIIMSYLMLSRAKGLLITSLIIVVSLTAFLTFYNLDEFIMFERVVSSDESSSGKLGLIVAGLSALILNPFGVTEASYYEMKEWSYSLFKSSEILKYPSHNGLINLGFEYTALVYVPLSFFVLYLVCSCKNMYRDEKIFWFVAWLSFFIQQSFHNNGLFFVEFNILIVLALFKYRIYKCKL